MPPRSCLARPSATPSRTSCGRCARQFASLAEFRAFRCAGARRPARGRGGNLGSPVKAATDVLRDTREALRSAVEYGGLTPASHRYFVEEFNAVTNRISFGPPRRRNLEYLALHAAGIIDIAGGPGARLRRAGARFHRSALWRARGNQPGGRAHRGQAGCLFSADRCVAAVRQPAGPGTGPALPEWRISPGRHRDRSAAASVGADGVPERASGSSASRSRARISIRTRCRAAHRLAPDTRRRSVRARADRHDRRRRDEACPASAGPVCRESAGVAGRGMSRVPF